MAVEKPGIRNILLLFEEDYMATLNDYNNRLLSDNESDDDGSSVATINSISTVYTESPISEADSVLTLSTSRLEMLQFAPLERSSREQIVDDFLEACLDNDINTPFNIDAQIHEIFEDTSGMFQVFL